MRDFQMPKSACPWCGHEMDYATTPFGLDSPSAGDLSICIRCAGFLVFDTKLQLQKLEPTALPEIGSQDFEAYMKLINLQSVVRQANKALNKKAKRNDRGGGRQKR